MLLVFLIATILFVAIVFAFCCMLCKHENRIDSILNRVVDLERNDAGQFGNTRQGVSANHNRRIMHLERANDTRAIQMAAIVDLFECINDEFPAEEGKKFRSRLESLYHLLYEEQKANNDYFASQHKQALNEED